MFLEYGFKSVTMDDIAEKMGISKKTIYANYATKTKLVHDVAFNIIRIIQINIAEIKKKNINAIEELFEVKKQVNIFLKDEKSSPQFQLQKYYTEIFESLEAIKYETIESSIKENVTKGIEEGLFREDIDKNFICKIYHSGLNAVRDASIFSKDNYKKSDLFQLFIDYHIRAIATKKGLKILKDQFNKNETTTT